MAFTPIIDGEDGDDVRDKLNNLSLAVCPAEWFGFVKGDVAGAAATNLAKWNEIQASGGHFHFGNGVWKMNFSQPNAGPAMPLRITGNGDNTVFEVANVDYFKPTSGILSVEDIFFDAGDANSFTSGSLISLDSKTADIDTISVTGCRFRNMNTVIISSASGTNRFRTRLIEGGKNIVFNRNGFCRIQRSRQDKIKIYDNFIDGKNSVAYGRSGHSTGYGGIIVGYSQDNAPDGSFQPEDIGAVTVDGNWVRNIKRRSNPGGGGNYGIQIQAFAATVRNNLVEKIYPFFGTPTASPEALFTTAGGARQYSFTTASFPTPDSMLFYSNGTLIGDDDDRGWARGGNDGSGASAAQFGMGRAYIGGTGFTGWIDYNTKQGEIVFDTAPADGIAVTTTYFSGTTGSDVEPIYVKASFQHITDNFVLDCSNNQGAICPKGGGSFGYEKYSIADGYPATVSAGGVTKLNNPWRGSGGSMYGATVMFNTIRNRIHEGVFSDATGVWVQQDNITISHNTFEGLAGRCARTNISGSKGRLFDFSYNKIIEHWGSSVVNIQGDTGCEWTGINVSNNQVDGWWGGYGSSGGVTELQFVRLTGSASGGHKAVFVGNNLVTERVNPAKIVCAVSSDSVNADVTVDGFRCLFAGWYMFFERSTVGVTAGRRRAQNYCTENMAVGTGVGTMTRLGAGSAAITNTTTANSYA